MALEITAARPDPALLDLPWRVPLEQWPEDILAALPRGISRHVVRFVRLSGGVLAVKEIKADLARREYEMLRSLNRLDMPCVEPFAVVSGRIGTDGRELDAVPGHPSPAVLPALPRAVQPVPAQGHRDPAHRRAGRPPRPAAPRRLLVG